MYSMDPEENKRNSETPSTVSMEHQLVYKIASLEATISNSLRRLDEKFDRMQTELHDRHIEAAQQMTALAASVDSRFTIKRNRIDNVEKDIIKLRNELVKEIETETDKVDAHARAEREAICKRVETLEHWKTVTTTRAGLALGAIVVFWSLFGDSVQAIVQRTFGV